MSEISEVILSRLFKRRAELQTRIAEESAKPQSYSIQGSYSETARDLDKLHAEMDALDAKIRAISGQGGDIDCLYPRYERSY